jgi:Domain of unknown function (DUF5655)/Domain of unknown function (DUF4287)
MASVEDGLRAQVRNIEATYGRPMGAWTDLIRATGLQKHGEIVAMLKAEHGMTHGSANRVALVALDAMSGDASPAAEKVNALYAGRRSALWPIHVALMETIATFGSDVEVAPKKGYVSLRRRRQFGLIQPGASDVSVGLILRGLPVAGRLESASTFNAMFTHRVRVSTVDDVDAELTAWLRRAYEEAGAGV